MGYNYEKKTVETKAFVGGTCDRCGADIPKLHEDDYYSTNLDGGIEIYARGWYGGLIDSFPGIPYEDKLLCSNCGRKFLDEWFPEVWNEYVRPDE